MDLRQRIWAGPLADPAQPGRGLADRSEYTGALAEARLLVRMALPVDLSALQARWPWSIDLAWLSIEAEADSAPLERAVGREHRRLGALAWGLWTLDRPEEALAVLADLDATAETHAEDRAALAELRILMDLPADDIPGPKGSHLALLQTWRQEGAAGLARRLELEGAALPAHAPLWSWLVDVFVQERDFARARDVMTTFETRLPDHPELATQRIRLALESEDHALARRLLNAQGERDQPWLWSPRRHAQHLRCLAAEIAARPAPDYTGLKAQSEAALRLYPRNIALQGLHQTARELTEDWETLAQDLVQPGPALDPMLRTSALIRLGLPDQALALIGPEPRRPDAALRHRIRRAEALLRCGDLIAADAALGPVPVAAPLAADHAFWKAEIACAARHPEEVNAAIAPALKTSPTHMGLLLTDARAAFQSGDDARALGRLATFRRLKTAQLGSPPQEDLRDKIVQDAASGLPGPGLAARSFARVRPPFTPSDGPEIPRKVFHYWEGPRSGALDRSLRAWAALYPQTLFDAQAAHDWLSANTDLAPLFDRLTQPAARADLFRVALIARHGGIFVDLDEYPRQPIDDWLPGAEAVLVIEEGHGTIANNFLAARPALPLFQRLEKRIALALTQTDRPYPWWHSGPAPLTVEAQADREAKGLRFLTQPEYDSRIATNLPFPHKRGPDHWR